MRLFIWMLAVTSVAAQEGGEPKAEGHECASITVHRHGCPAGTILASFENVTLCQDELCSRLRKWQMVGLDEPNMTFVGYGYGSYCGVMIYGVLAYGTPGDVLCVPGDEPPPTPPSENCSAITVETGSCPSGTILASSGNVTLCQEELCSRIGTWEILGLAEPNVSFVGEGYAQHCGVQDYPYVTPGRVLCLPGDEPPPTPPSEDCTALTVETGSCPAGTILASYENVTLCQEELCSRLETWEMVGFDEKNRVVVGNGYDLHCGVQSYFGTPGRVLCAPGEKPPTPPTPVPPSRECSAMTVQRSSCPAGTILASYENVTLCQEELCRRIDAWQMVGFDEPNVTFVGYGYDQHCGVQTYYGTPGEVLCVPGDEPPPTPPSEDCTALTVETGSCPAGTILASYENVTLCQEELCGRIDAWQLVGFDEPNVTFVGYGYDQHCGVQTYYGTPGEVLCVPGDEPPPTPPSENCTALTVETGSCPAGTILASYENVTLCQEELCSRLETWEMVGFDEKNRVVVGNGYDLHCGVQSYFGTPGRVLCVPGEKPPTPPTPVPPSRECSAITVQRSSCPAGTLLASYENVTLCQEELCRRLDAWQLVGFDEPNVTFVGYGYAQHCGVQTYYGTPGEVLCVPGDEPPPTPPSENCSAITVETGSCPAGTILASYENVTLCQEELCSRLETWEMVGFDEKNRVVVGNGYDLHCGVQSYFGTPGRVLCAPGEKPPTPPTPVPPSRECSAMTVQRSSCPAGTILASYENVTLCQEELCRRIDAWQMVGFDEPNVTFVGYGYAQHCGVQTYYGTPGEVLCVPGDEPPPTPPSENCSAITVETGSCPAGTILASYENVTLCQEELCSRLETWEMVGFDEKNRVVVGNGYDLHCGVQSYFGTPGRVLCAPGEKPPTPPTPVPPSRECSAMTVQRSSCPAGTILASYENVTLCQEELCRCIDAWQMVGFDEPNVTFVGYGYAQHCGVQTYYGTPGEVLCVPGDEPPPTPPSENCSAITVETGSCPAGTILASYENVTLCQEELCSRLETWEMVGFDEKNRVVVGNGYDLHCGVQSYFGTPGRVLCAPGEKPPTPPTPVPPSRECSAMTVQRSSCPAGTILASYENVTLCQEELCRRIDAWQMVGFDEPNVTFVGYGYAQHCGVQPYYGTPGEVLCVPGEKPPTPPTPVPSSRECSAITVQRSSCPAGTILASYENVTLCQEELCGRIDAWQLVGFDEPNVTFVGYGYAQHCGVQSYYGTPGEVLCVPGDEPPPTPPSETCSAIAVVSGPSCAAGYILASSENVTLCQEQLCSIIDTWQMVRFDEPNVAFVGSGYAQHCGVQTYYGTPGDVVCVPGDEPPPTPPSENCSAITLETGSCPAGTILASSENVTLCQEELCSRIGVWEMVGYAKPGMVYVGYGYKEQCGVLSFSGHVPEVLCVPAPVASLEAALSQSQPSSSSGVTSAAVRLHHSVSASSFILPVLFVVVGVLCVGVVRRLHANRLSQGLPSGDLSEEVLLID